MILPGTWDVTVTIERPGAETETVRLPVTMAWADGHEITGARWTASTPDHHGVVGYDSDPHISMGALLSRVLCRLLDVEHGTERNTTPCADDEWADRVFYRRVSEDLGVRDGVVRHVAAAVRERDGTLGERLDGPLRELLRRARHAERWHVPISVTSTRRTLEDVLAAVEGVTVDAHEN